MTSFDATIIKLVGLANFLEQQDRLEESLGAIAAMAASLLNSQNCSIMLLREDDDNEPVMKIFASHGYLPPDAFTEKARHKEGIAGQVAATGQALLVQDISDSPFAPKARWPERQHKGFLSAPAFIGQKVCGVINVNTPLDERRYTEKDLYLLTTVALIVGKSIQIAHLQGLVKSRFAQLAFRQEAQMAVEHSIAQAALHPARMARVFGKAFYQEMHRAGLADDQIISAATEVISLLGEKLHKRMKPREDAGS